MIAVVPVRFTSNTDANSVWSQELLEHWMQPLRTFSLGHFWWLSSRGVITPEAVVLPAVVMADPRTGTTNDELRGSLVAGVVAAASAQNPPPDWASVDILLLWFAQATDAFGGGTAEVPLAGGGTKQVATAVLDIDSPFSVCAQELGHALGFGHELDAAGNDYQSPYSSMSSRTTTAEFLRDEVAGLPRGSETVFQRRRVDVQRIVGARIPGAQFYALDAYRQHPSVVTLADDWGQAPVTLRVSPPNYQDRYPTPPVTLVAVPSQVPGDTRLFFVELRRGGFDYDQGIGGGTPAGLTVHSRNPDGRIRYDGVAPVALAAEHREWVCPAGRFVLRFERLGPNLEWADIRLRRGNEAAYPIRGVLLAGGFRTQRELNAMTPEDMRNTLIVEQAAHSSETDQQRHDDHTLAGIGAAMVFLRSAGIRSDAELQAMTADDQRNTLIVEVGLQTGLGQELQGWSNLDLIRTVLGSDVITRGRAPGVVGSYLRGVLLLGGFRSQHELNAMSSEDMRNTLIVELTNRTADRNYQAYSTPDLVGVGAVLVAVRHLGVLTDDALRTTTADNMRNALIVELDAQTGAGRNLQGVDNLGLAMIPLGIVPPL